MKPFTFIVLAIAINVLLFADCVLYCAIVVKHGAQNKLWPGSGIYLALNPKAIKERE